MSDLATFAGHVQEVICDAFRERLWAPGEADRYMADFSARRQTFEKLALGLTLDIVEPRLRTLAAQFPNALLAEEGPPHQSRCQFEHCERFPAFASVEFSVEHDVRFERLILHSRTRIMPVFVRFNEQDNLPLPLDAVDADQAADWVEERLLEFLDVYLRIDAAECELGEQPATDPVCGMKILRSAASATGSYYGHPYFFCSEACLKQFNIDPSRYVQVKTL